MAPLKSKARGAVSSVEGISNSVPLLMEAQRKFFVVRLVNSWTQISWSYLFKLFLFGKSFSSLALDGSQTLEEILSGVKIIHVHDLWNVRQLLLLSYVVRNYRLKLVLSPRGALSDVALSRSRLRKKFFLYGTKYLLRESMVHFLALTSSEAGQIQEHFALARCKVMPNGLSISTFQKIATVGREVKSNKKVDDFLEILFLGRFDVFIKGLDILFDAVKKLESKKVRAGKFRITFIGEHRKSPEFDSRQFFKLLRDSLDNPDLIEVLPPIFDDEKFKRLARADALILPSRTEGFPNVILEALATGTPVLVSLASNVGDLVDRHNCGWSFDSTANLVLRLEKICALPKEQLLEMGRNGVNLIEEQFILEHFELSTMYEF